MLAALPLLLVLGALLARQSTFRAAVLGLVSAVLLAATWFGLSWEDATAATRQWWPLVVEVMLIVGGGIAFAEAGRRIGDQSELSGWLRSRLGNGVAPALAVVHGVTPLAESLTGFGVGVAIAVPLLVGLGYEGRKAAPIALLGLCAVPWGSMGPGTLIASQLTGVSFHELGLMCALLSLPVFLGAGIAAALIAADRTDRGHAMMLAVASGLVLWASIWAANFIFGTAPAGAVGAAFTLAVHLLIHRMRGTVLSMSRRQVHAAAPYALLLGGVLSVSVLLRGAGLEESWWRYAASPALWLALTTVFTVREQLWQLRPTLAHALRTWGHVGPATGMFIVVGAVMAISGMSGHIASALAGAGGFYFFLVPFIGGTGGFVTGSNSGANAMFAGPQAQTAATLGAPVLPVAAAQNVSASLLTMASPARVELAVRLCPDQPARQPAFRTILTVNGLIVLGLSAMTAMLTYSAGAFPLV